MTQVDCIIIGAGAAGMFAAIEAGRRGRRVLVVEHGRAAGEKIRISGGGRCNFTNTGISAERFLSQNPRFALSALKRYSQWDFVTRMDRAGIAWHEKTLGQLFCDGSATQVVAMLLADMAAAGGELWLGCSVTEVRQVATGFEVETPRGRVRAASVVVASGGKSIPKMGATGFGYKIADTFFPSVLEGIVNHQFGAHPKDFFVAARQDDRSFQVRFEHFGVPDFIRFTDMDFGAIVQVFSFLQMAGTRAAGADCQKHRQEGN